MESTIFGIKYSEKQLFENNILDLVLIGIY